MRAAEHITRNALHTVLLGTTVNSPKLTTPFPFVSNSWNAVLYRASGTHSSPSNAWNSGNEMSLQTQKTTIMYIIQTFSYLKIYGRIISAIMHSPCTCT
jgi:hypothetical protein